MATGIEANTPRPTSRCAAGRMVCPPVRSSTLAILQAPIGISEAIGCSLCPNHDPDRRYLMVSGAVAFETHLDSGFDMLSSDFSCSLRLTTSDNPNMRCSSFITQIAVQLL